MNSKKQNVLFYVLLSLLLSTNAKGLQHLDRNTHTQNSHPSSFMSKSANNIQAAHPIIAKALSGNKSTTTDTPTTSSTTSSATTTIQPPDPGDKCCPPLYLSAHTIKQIPDNICKSTCIEGLTIVAMNCVENLPASDSWNIIGPYLDSITLIKSHLELNGVTACTFAFTSLKTIKAKYVIIQNNVFSKSFLKSLETVEPLGANCDVLVATEGLKAQPGLNNFNAAVAKGKAECLAALPTTTTTVATTPQCPTVPACPTTVATFSEEPTTTSSRPSTGDPILPPYSGNAAAVAHNPNNNVQPPQCDDTVFTPAFLIMVCLCACILTATAIAYCIDYYKRTRREAKLTTIFRGPMYDAFNVMKMFKGVKEVKAKCKKDIQDKKVAVTFGPAAKNRYNLVCIEATRVKLEGMGDEKDADFIHANFVDVPGHEKRFIATQGPMFNTIYDFWLMAVQQKCDHVIKVTDNAETNSKGKETAKCKEYYPHLKGESMKFKLNNVGEKEVEVKCVRSKLVRYGRDTQVRKTVLSIEFPNTNMDSHKVTVWNWLNWPDHSAPLDDEGAMLKILTTTFKSKTPIIVHCSAGVGRTGAVIMTGYIWSQIQELQTVHWPLDILTNLRKCRADIVKNFAQFLFPLQVATIYIRRNCEFTEEWRRGHNAFTKVYQMYATKAIEDAKKKGEEDDDEEDVDSKGRRKDKKDEKKDNKIEKKEKKKEEKKEEGTGVGAKTGAGGTGSGAAEAVAGAETGAGASAGGAGSGAGAVTGSKSAGSVTAQPKTE